MLPFGAVMIIIALSVNCCGKYIPWVLLIGKVSSDENGMDPTAKKPKCNNQHISCTQENNSLVTPYFEWDLLLAIVLDASILYSSCFIPFSITVTYIPF